MNGGRDTDKKLAGWFWHKNYSNSTVRDSVGPGLLHWKQLPIAPLRSFLQNDAFAISYPPGLCAKSRMGKALKITLKQEISKEVVQQGSQSRP